MRYKVMIDYKNFIPIDQTELEKALRAMATEGKAFFNEGATDRIHAVIPDYHAMMGYNYGYELLPEDWQEIGNNKECNEAKQLVIEIKDRIAGRVQKPQELGGEIKKLADKMRP